MKKIIGITGGMGSGKSSVSRCLRELGCRVLDADQIAREETAAGSPALERIKAAFGPAVLDQSGALRRAALAEAVFGDPEKLALLNAITHEPIRQRLLAEAERFRRGEEQGLLFLDVPLLFESGLSRITDENWTVDLPLERQKQRVAGRDGLSADQIEKRLAAQLSREERLALSDVIIDNSGSEEDLRCQVLCQLKRLSGEEE